MRLIHRAAVTVGMVVPAACAPTASAVRGRSQDSAVGAAESSTTKSMPAAESSAPTSAAGGESQTPPAAGPTTTVTFTAPHATTTTTLVLPEHRDDDLSDVEWLVRQTFPEDPDRAAAIARRESGFDPGATNGQYLGVMQIGSVTHADLIASMGYSTADLLNAVVNLHVARRLFDLAGWSPWA